MSRDHRWIDDAGSVVDGVVTVVEAGDDGVVGFEVVEFFEVADGVVSKRSSGSVGEFFEGSLPNCVVAECRSVALRVEQKIQRSAIVVGVGEPSSVGVDHSGTIAIGIVAIGDRFGSGVFHGGNSPEFVVGGLLLLINDIIILFFIPAYI